MPRRWFLCSVCGLILVLGFSSFVCPLKAQGVKQNSPETPISRSDADHTKERNEWFYRGRIVRGQPSAELRRRAYEAKLKLRAQRAAALAAASANGQVSWSTGSWIPLGPVPLASDASGNGTQDYHQVAGRATAVAIDPADPTGNTVYIGGAQSGIWKSTNAANATANSVTWTPVSDDQATLSIGAIAIQPGNADPAKSVVLAATGEANNSGDSYFGLGILRSTDAGNSWNLIRTANNGALSFSGLGGTRLAFGNSNTVVAAMATTSEGIIDGAVSTSTTRGLYTSLNAGQSWSYNASTDAGVATDATSATSVAYNAIAGKFFAAIRYHGFYSSADGVTWSRLAAQPGGIALSTSACPPQSTSNNRSCPIYRGEITVVPGRNEMYAWYIYVSANGSTVDGGLWQSSNGGTSWAAISDAGITNCGDVEGCGVEQGAYNLELLAVPNGATATDLYAGAINLYKCGINTQNPTCTSSPFFNLTHVYGCNPIAAPAHVHPDQHALASMIPASGSDSGNALMYFANDGGIYRALDGYAGLVTGACSGVNQFDDLNQNLGSMTQLVGFSQHPTDQNTILGGAEGNGSPATSQATSNPSWGNVLGGDGGYNAIDPTAPLNWYATNPDIPPAGLGVQLCTSGVNCTNSGFGFVVTSDTVGGDDGAYYFPYILDPKTAAMLVGTCRIWRGPRTGGTFTALSPNFDTLGSGTCSGSEVNQVRALAAGGVADSQGSGVIYATTGGSGPLDGPLSTPPGGHVWVTTDATTGPAAFADVTDNGPQGNINPNQFPISGVALDSSDSKGQTAYITVMGFTGGTGHVWKTTNAGATWTDFTGNLPDSPSNAVVVYPPLSQVFVATDVGVFGSSSTSTPSWTELGPNPSSKQYGYLPNVAITSLGVFASGGAQLLRASTYGRGIWQFNLVITPDFNLRISNSPQTVFAGQTATFNGTATGLDGYASAVTLSCVSGTTAPPSPCTASPSTLTPANNTPFAITAGGSAGDYSFSVKAVGSDASHITHTVPLTLHLVGFGLTTPSPSSVTVNRGTTSPAVGFQITAAGSFNQSVTVSCTTGIGGCNLGIAPATCNLPSPLTVNPTSSVPVKMNACVTVPVGAATGSYPVTIQASTAGAPSTLSASFTLNVTSNPDFVLTESSAFPEVNAGSSGINGPISIASQDGFSGTVTLACPSTYGAGSCSISPSSVSSFPAMAALTINGTSFGAGNYSLTITGTSGSIVHNLAVPFNVGDFSISGTQNVSGTPGGQVTENLKLESLFSYAGKINATCDASALSGAMCTLTPANPISIASGATTNLNASINIPNDGVPGAYKIIVNTQDTSGAPSHSANFTLTLGQDFRVTSATASQTVTAGQTSGPYALTIQPVGSSFSGAVSVACGTGLPAQAKCIFSPSGPVTPGNSAVNVVMSISTKAATANLRWSGGRAWIWYATLLLPGISMGLGNRRSRRKRRRLTLAGFLPFILLLISCAGVSSGGGGGGTPPSPVTYQITVTGTSPGTPADAGQSAIVSLVVD
ncbi:MAG TPA: hypothetical protein VGS05_02825 [Candidatus Sulfotelmatobacter sp.]|nr:hypothetical protein [Candidatus Sulfotelmatobacter sp.]